ncbi:FG-GAP and VCBS repeat-containing protein [Streptomyces sp. NPDC007808]|uniref:FG-GAP and VCBS repeat-containing protein n=1 Tax=Streptomyces sp. NPDC007808 TaxID=3364779 RepID=UPI0036AE09C3
MFSLKSSSRWAVPAVAGVLALGVLPAGHAGRAEAATAPPVRDDFNGDGYQDLAVGALHGTVGGRPGAGFVTVMYGGPHGLSAGRSTVISRATSGVPGSPVENQEFGAQLAKGDLNGDRYADLVIGFVSGPGDAVIVWGAPQGLSGAGSAAIDANRTTTGDFDGDGKLDLAAFRTGQAPGDDPVGTTAGVWSGPFTRTGTPARTAPLDPEHLRYVDVKDGAVGDVDGDGRDDLALRAYCGDGVFDCTKFYRSSATGLTRATAPDGEGDVALGDVNGDGCDDLLVGFRNEERIEVAYGSPSGLTPSGTWTSYSQDTPGVPGTSENGDHFGSALAVGDITGDGIDDVVVGAPGEGLGEAGAAGVVDVLRGSRTGLTGTGAQAFTQNTAGVPGTAEPGDTFGNAVRILDINGNGYADLAAAAKGEDNDNGAVWLLRGRPAGIVTDAALVFGGRAVGAPYARSGFGSEVG